MISFPAREMFRTRRACASSRGWRAFEKPIVAAVDGIAIGIGTTMLLHCDLVYASPSASLKIPFVDLGLTPEGGSSVLLARRCGMARASELLLLGEEISAERALSFGLVNAIVPGKDLRRHALAKAKALAAKPREALAATRKMLRGDIERLGLGDGRRRSRIREASGDAGGPRRLPRLHEQETTGLSARA